MNPQLNFVVPAAPPSSNFGAQGRILTVEIFLQKVALTHLARTFNLSANTYRAMLIRISLFVAIIAALAAGALSFTQVRGKINTLMQQRDGYHTDGTRSKASLTAPKRTLATDAGHPQTNPAGFGHGEEGP